MVHVVASLVFLAIALAAAAMIAAMLGDVRHAIVAALGLDTETEQSSRAERRVRVRVSKRPAAATVRLRRAA